METNIDNLKKLLDSLKTIGFWERLFGWNKLRELFVDAVIDLQNLIANNQNIQQQYSDIQVEKSNLVKDYDLAKQDVSRKENEIANLKISNQNLSNQITQFTKDLSARDTVILGSEKRINQLEGDYKVLTETSKNLLQENKKLSETSATSSETITNLSARKNQLDIELATLRQELKNVQDEFKIIKQQNTQLVTEEENRKVKYENDVATLTSIKDQIQNDRNKEVEQRNIVEIERIRKLKETWANHQESAKGLIKTISNKYSVEYVDKVPFKGEPDNTLKIADEYVIFDAKSPGSDDLSNFPTYLKDQAERAKKYVKEDGVKKEIYFVVPTNTLERLQQFVFPLADYKVFIISLDSLEPVILSLQKIEGYEFAEKLSPEDRENICRVLGKFAHLTKRRIQIDSFFIKQFIELAYKAENDLPKDILVQSIEFEKAEKLNPPTEKRVKQINLKELDKESSKVINESGNKVAPISEEILASQLNNLPLYDEEANESIK